MDLEFFDPTQEVSITARNLPHWFQPGATYFVTFRTSDSLPVAVLEEWNVDRKLWLEQQGIQINDPGWKSKFEQLPFNDRAGFARRFNAKFHRMLDAGHGACPLKHPAMSQIVSDAILHFDGTR